ncbi:MAG: NYN domain-containing protein [Thermoflexales bacterium]|nr:NYN domain-containing protein [Thermoflexales bacterium]MDW8351610.1 NYN domain-containing protein [Anaerolineae bacterium]
MPLLIDGHNLIGHSPDLSLSDPNDEAKLIARLKTYIARTGKEITVVFDPGQDSDPISFDYGRVQEGRLEVIYAQAWRKADDVIREIVGEAKDRRGLIVVTSDGALANFTRQCGVRVRSATEFEREMRQALNAALDDEKPTPSVSEVSFWSEIFREPERAVKPKPAPPQLSPQERKRQRRMAQLKRQVRGGGQLR